MRILPALAAALLALQPALAAAQAPHPLGDLHSFAGFDRIRALEQEYLGAEAMTKYADSVGHVPKRR